MNRTAEPGSANGSPKKVALIPILANYLSIYDATWRGYGGIVVWGGWYGIAVPFLFVVIGFLWSSFEYGIFGGGFSPRVGDLVGALSIWAGTIAIGGAIGLMLSGLFGLIVTLLISFMNFTLDHIWTPITAISIAGGLTGYLSGFAVWMGPISSSDSLWAVILYIVGPFAAMIFGQIGALRMVSKQLALYYRAQKTKVQTLWEGDVRQNFSKFSLKHLLVITGWFGALSAIISAVGQFNFLVALILGSYVLVQLPVFYWVNHVCRKYVASHLSTVRLTESEVTAMQLQDCVESADVQSERASEVNPFEF